MISAVPIYYTQRQTVHTRSLSPSSDKPRHAVDSWQCLNVPLEIIEPEPVSIETLCLAHSHDFVEGVLSCRLANGFGNKSPKVAATLAYTTGAFLAAARAAISNGEVAVAPCSGFHHAGYANARGYCTFNGLAVTALALKRDGLAGKVGILDCDQHFGDGTAEIIKRLDAGSWIKHVTVGETHWMEGHAPYFLRLLPGLARQFAGCDVLLYQAGADPHINDPLGGWLTTEQLALRDRIVFETARVIGLPVAWNLAGGYQTPLRRVLDIHDNTLLACADTYGISRNDRASEGISESACS